MSKYANDPKWADVVPVPHDDGGADPLAAIAYTEAYAEAMSYLRAVMADNEVSERALALTADIISMNPAHYTIWIYRASILKSLPEADLRSELVWLNTIALKNLKNYQIWHHRQGLVDALADPTEEQAFMNAMLAEDAKNYHVWSYRQWFVARFDLWDDDAEWDDVRRLLAEDVRNNSVWNHRFYLLSRGRRDGIKECAATSRIQDEILFAATQIRLAPQNQSPWSYVRGVVKGAGLPLSALRELCGEFVDLEKGDRVKSRHALDLLAEIWVEEEQRDKAGKAYELLATKYDPIRARYWEFCKTNFGLGGRRGVAA